MKDAKRMLGVSSHSLRAYAYKGVLTDHRSPGGHRVFDLDELETLRTKGQEHEKDKSVGGGIVIYARVSSRRQASEGDLDRQVGRLRAAAAGKRVVGVYTDVASGLSDRRRGLRSALSACALPEVTELWVAHPERLARFGTGAIEQLLGALGVALVAIGEDEAISGPSGPELVRDMLAVVTSFSGRLYGQRSAKARTLQACVRRNVA